MPLIKVYQGSFGYEQHLFDINPEDCAVMPNKGDFLHYQGTIYKVLYIMLDMDCKEYIVFVRESIEEDF